MKLSRSTFLWIALSWVIFGVIKLHLSHPILSILCFAVAVLDLVVWMREK